MNFLFRSRGNFSSNLTDDGRSDDETMIQNNEDVTEHSEDATPQNKRKKNQMNILGDKLVDTMDTFKTFLEKPRPPIESSQVSLSINMVFANSIATMLDSYSLEKQSRARSKILQMMSSFECDNFEIDELTNEMPIKNFNNIQNQFDPPANEFSVYRNNQTSFVKPTIDDRTVTNQTKHGLQTNEFAQVQDCRVINNFSPQSVLSSTSSNLLGNQMKTTQLNALIKSVNLAKVRKLPSNIKLVKFSGNN